MANGTSSLNPTILGRPLFPSFERIKTALSGLGSSLSIPSEQNLLPPSQLSQPTIPRMGPLIRTDYGRPPSERPDFRNPAEQWDVRKPIQTATSGSAPQPMAPSFLSPEQQSFYDYSRLSPQSQNVVSSVRQPVQKFEGLPTIEQQFPFQQYREPMAPVTADISGLRERVGIRTAYGMVYPTKGQEAAAQRLAQMPAMGARLAEAGKEVVRPQMVSSALSGIEAGRGPASLEGLTQAEKIQAMRVRGQQLAKQSRLEAQERFNIAENKKIEARKKDEEKRVSSAARKNPSRMSRRMQLSNERQNIPIDATESALAWKEMKRRRGLTLES